ncbi:MAG: glucokinase [Devosia sp.]
MVEHSRQALVGAIGGTYISLAIADIDELTIANFALLNSADFTDPMQAIERYLKSVPRCPNKVGIAVAGTVDGDSAKLTYRPWTITKNDVRATTGADHVHLVNDFEAMALMLPHLSSYDLVPLSEGDKALHANKIVLYSGTGLGVAGIVHDGAHWVAIRGEAGGMAFPTPPAKEFDLKLLFPGKDFVSVSDVFSGRGLVALYEALAKSKGETPRVSGARRISEAGLGNEDATATEALNLIATWLGRFAGDMAMVYGARGGVYLTGGFAANIIPILTNGRFMDAFENKGGSAAWLKQVPVNIIKTAADAGLRGAALALAESLPVRPAATRKAGR